MIVDHLLRSKFCRPCKWHRLLRPWRHDHPLLAILRQTIDPIHNIADAVNKTHLHLIISHQPHTDRFLRNKLRLCCHNGFAVCRLWQFIPRSLPVMLIRDRRKHQKLHKTLDKCRFAGADRTAHSQINLAIGSAGDVCIYLKFLHGYLPEYIGNALVHADRALHGLLFVYLYASRDSNIPLPLSKIPLSPPKKCCGLPLN